MEKRKRSKAEWIRRYVSFVFILFPDFVTQKTRIL